MVTTIRPARSLPPAADRRHAPPHGAVTDTRSRHRTSPGRAEAPRVGVIDGSDIVRAGLPLILTGFSFPAVCSTAADFLRKRPPADVVVFGFDGSAAPALDALAITRLDRAGYRVCVYTCETRPAILARCVRAGARGIMLKTGAVAALEGAIVEISAGGTVVDDSMSDAIDSAAHVPDLTRRQLQVLTARARGETFQSIAERLQISERTAQDHWTAIARRYEEFLRHNSAADLERSLGLDSGAAPLNGRWY